MSNEKILERLISGGLNMGWISDEEAARLRASLAQRANSLQPGNVDKPFGWVHGVSYPQFIAGEENPWKEAAGAFPVYTAPPPQPDSKRDAARWRAYRVSAAAAMAGLHSEALDAAVDKLVAAMAAHHNETGDAK